MENAPYRITIEQYNEKVTIELDHSDIKIDEYADLLRRLSLAAGWDFDQVDKICKDN